MSIAEAIYNTLSVLKRSYMIDFNEVPKVAVDFMNDDHEEATNVTNALLALVGAADNGEVNSQEISDTLNELLLHCQEHFAREEKQMQKIDFPPYPVHQGEHQRVLAEMEGELLAWNKEGDVERLKRYAEITLPEWFIGHIKCMDTVTAMFISQSGGPF